MHGLSKGPGNSTGSAARMAASGQNRGAPGSYPPPAVIPAPHRSSGSLLSAVFHILGVSTLDRYIARQFIITILSVFALCLALIYFIDLIELLRQAGKRENVSGASMLVVALLRLPAFAELTLPFAVLIGSIGAFLRLSRSSELVVMRAAGISAWQFIRPALLVALTFGILSTAVYNPLAATAKARADRITAEKLGSNKGILENGGSAWLRQDGVDGPSIIHARAVADKGQTLGGVTVLQFDRNRKFVERIEADKATLHPGYWSLNKAFVDSPGAIAKTYDSYIISTYLTFSQVRGSIASAKGVSFWDLPDFIDMTTKAGLSTTPYQIQYQLLLARPLLLMAMVLIAATCSLKPFRFGRIQTMVITGLSAGFGFFIFAEMSRKIGLSGLVSPAISAWAPIIIAALLAATALLHQEDG